MVDRNEFEESSQEDKALTLKALVYAAEENPQAWFEIVFPEVFTNELADHHKDFLGWLWGIGPNRPRPFVAVWPRGHAKALDIDTPILTPGGWSTMGALKAGDEVYGEDGKPTRVKWVSGISEKESFRVEFDGGEDIVACGEHLWTTLSVTTRRQMNREKFDASREDWWKWEPRARSRVGKSSGAKTLTTTEIKDTLRYGNQLDHTIPLASPVHYPTADLPVDPYVLGYWLGDGESAGSRITIGERDYVDAVNLLGKRWSDLRECSQGVTLVGFKTEARSLGVLNNKHIPEIYLRASVDQRWDLLRGLMDSDGTQPINGSPSFCTTKAALNSGFVELANSLGLRARSRQGVARLYGKDCGPVWNVLIPTQKCPFLLPRKVEYFTPCERRSRWRNIKSVTSVGARKVQCIAVENESNLFLAGRSLIPTHNSTFAELAVIAMACLKRRAYVLYVSGTQDLAEKHLISIAEKLEGSKMLNLCYPDVANRKTGKYGHSKGWNVGRLRTESGFTIDAIGLDKAARGIKIEDQRPDFIVFDDIDDVGDTVEGSAKKLQRIAANIIPAGDRDKVAFLAVQNKIIATGVFAALSKMPGDDHTIEEAEPTDMLLDRIISGPIPAVHNLTYEKKPGGGSVITGGEPSWPAGADLEQCQKELNDTSLTEFLREMQHETSPPGRGMFEDSVRVVSHCKWEEVPWGDLAVTTVWCDPAVSTNESSDTTAIQCDALGNNDVIYRLRSWEGKKSARNCLKIAIRWAYDYRSPVVGVETDQGGHTWEPLFDSVYAELIESGVVDETVHRVKFASEKAGSFSRAKAKKAWPTTSASDSSKVGRARLMLEGGYEQDGKIVHVWGDHEHLERALIRFPRTKPFDLCDAAFWSWFFLQCWEPEVLEMSTAAGLSV